MKICFVFFKVKHNDSQWCFSISYLQWIVISIAYSTRLDVFQCPGRKNIKKIEEKRKKKKNHRIWIDFKPIYRPWLMARMKFFSVFHGSRQCYKFFRNFVLRLHVKSFIPTRRNPSLVLPGSCFAGTEFHFASNHS